ncbi:hypothetical protein M427DRAFT_45259 [Gonapodya prolifera JEL478]|uniref:Uncharacterized protein n=1 Tax=Gonapodya prolifera (strain JEL478) TaxID=1344416 RepID=A0A139ABS9_GONPJ|nr:hypothetical protein M427DRAFT_45259 [Gonapodya prolifera JEL478]|eukprot:KXS14207.1 hypothetical protein M427DRAFT_45259 [Gonapodya prolifera JEL478]
MSFLSVARSQPLTQLLLLLCPTAHLTLESLTNLIRDELSISETALAPPTTVAVPSSRTVPLFFDEAKAFWPLTFTKVQKVEERCVRLRSPMRETVEEVAPRGGHGRIVGLARAGTFLGAIPCSSDVTGTFGLSSTGPVTSSTSPSPTPRPTTTPTNAVLAISHTPTPTSPHGTVRGVARDGDVARNPLRHAVMELCGVVAGQEVRTRARKRRRVGTGEVDGDGDGEGGGASSLPPAGPTPTHDGGAVQGQQQEGHQEHEQEQDRNQVQEQDDDDEEDAFLLTGLSIYTLHEPCLMCAMALVHSRVENVFYWLPDVDLGRGVGGVGGAGGEGGAWSPSLPGADTSTTTTTAAAAGTATAPPATATTTTPLPSPLRSPLRMSRERRWA